MTEKYIKEFQRLMNFGILEDEILTQEEKIRRTNQFRKELSIQKYEELFNEICLYLKQDNINSLEKGQVVDMFLDFITYFPQLEDNVTLLPVDLLNLYYAYFEFKRILIMLSIVNGYDFPSEIEITNLINEYMNLLENPQNQLFISYGPHIIEEINNMFVSYLEKEDFNQIKFKDSLDPSIVNTINKLKKDNFRNLSS